MPEPPFTKTPRSPFIELQSVDSTNNYARQLIEQARLQDLPVRQEADLHGTTVFAHEQVAGKGQRGKVWVSEKDMNIALSMLIKPQSILLTQQFQLSACAALAAHEFFMKYAGDESKIKWPNDIYWQDRKAGGILIENIVRSQDSGVGLWEWSIIGIGININQTSFPDDLPNPVSLKQITGKNFDTVPLAKEVSALLNEKFSELINNGFENIYKQYLHHLYKLNATVKLKKGNRLFEAMIKEVNTSGQLVVQHSMEEVFDFGIVEWVV